MTQDPTSENVPAIRLQDELETALTFQEYPAAGKIEGAWIRPLRKHRAANGWFTELFRLTDGRDGVASPQSAPMAVRQVSASFAEPGRINAFHIHPLTPQNELWTVLHGLLLVWLVDCRKESPTAGLRQRVILSSEEPVQLYIPAGVAHGYRAGAAGALLVYAMDEQFNPERPNEGRLPWDYFGAELWEDDRG